MIGIKLTQFETHHSNAKQWQRKYYHISDQVWEFPLIGATTAAEFLVCANLENIINDRAISFVLSAWEKSYVEMVYAWVEQNPYAI